MEQVESRSTIDIDASGLPIRIIHAKDPYLPLTIAQMMVIPRAGEIIHFRLDGRALFGAVAWVNHYPGNELFQIEVAVDFENKPMSLGGEESPDILTKIVDFNSRLYEKAASHNNVMMLAGYAGLFAIWGFIKDYLSQNATLWIGLLTGISLILFVLFELISTYKRSRSYIRFVEVSKKKPNDFLVAFSELQREENNSLGSAVIIWRLFFFPTVLTGFSATILLLVNVLLKLTLKQSWPN